MKSNSFRLVNNLFNGLFLILVLMSVFISGLVLMSNLVSAECFQGLDGVCDYNCIDVDFDCIENPHQEGIIYEEQQFLLEDFFNKKEETIDEGIFEESDVDSQKEDSSSGSGYASDFSFDSSFDSVSESSDSDSNSLDSIEYIYPDENNEDEYYEIIKEKDNSLPLGLIIGGSISILVLLGIILLIYLRVEHSKKIFATQQKQLIDYILKLRDQKYSDAQIKKLFLDRGYNEAFINGLFKSLRF